jgi:serine/tyrosine/threonine adenylyltransferase
MISMQPQFDNRFRRELPADPDHRNITRQVQGALWTPVQPTAVSAPQLIAHSDEVMRALGLTREQLHSTQWVNALSGNGLIEGMAPYATNYGGHQFGNWAGQLGDGRAIILGELVHNEHRFELQLKGAGPTPYSRRADGRAVLRSSIREFLCSEAMHYLGVPTTRALSLVTTGDPVERDMFYDGNAADEPGAIVCRVAPSFTRFGHFQLPAARDDVPLLRVLVSFTIARDFPELVQTGESPLTAWPLWFKTVCERTAKLVVEWMRVGFVHGVMNTDNMSILGLTIDYGPYGWVDNFDPMWTPNTTDANGKRYCYGRQPSIARWNCERLAEALAALDSEATVTPHLIAGLQAYDDTYNEALTTMLAAKFGWQQWRAQTDADLVNDAFELMQPAEIDMTIFFRSLARVEPTSTTELFADCFYRDDLRAQFSGSLADWLQRYQQRIASDSRSTADRRAAMNAVNPRFVLRNYLAQEAIDLSTNGDHSRISELLDMLRQPYDEQIARPNREHYLAKRPDWARQKAGCSMLSCSS